MASWGGMTPGDYYVGMIVTCVDDYDTSDNTGYDVTPITITSDPGGDIYEPNDTPGTAYDVGTASISQYVCPTVPPSGDEDWFQFCIPFSAYFYICVDLDPPSGADYDVYVHDGSVALLYSSTTAGDGVAEVITQHLGHPQDTYYVQVVGKGEDDFSSVPYSLYIHIWCPGASASSRRGTPGAGSPRNAGATGFAAPAFPFARPARMNRISRSGGDARMRVLGFKGGVHPPERKVAAEKIAVETFPAPEKLVVPLSQHIGAPAGAVVEKGQAVRKGELLGDAAGFVSARVHSPVSGKVKGLTDCLHPLGMKVRAVEIENDGREEWVEGANVERAGLDGLSPDDVKKIIQDAGVVGMGGATFPTHVKLSPPVGKPIDSCILNGAECEPYLTADDRLMLEEPERVVKGFVWILRALGWPDVKVKGFIAVEANKRDAFEKVSSAAKEIASEVTCVLMPVKYPQGAEKQLIKSLLDRDVPPQTERGLPMDVGCVVQNVGTAAAVFDAVERNVPLIERIATVTGDAVSRPANLRVRVGTSVRGILEARGANGYRKLIMGGPMMGIAVPTAELPVNKGTSGILALRDGDEPEELPCIRCGRCVEACPMGLVASWYGLLGKAGMLEEMERRHVVDCIECGSCSYVCPSKIRLVHYAKLGKWSAAARAKTKAAK